MFTSQINEFVLPLPPLDEQEAIIKQITAAMRRLNEIWKLVEDELSVIPTLNQSILAKAFRGELVDQDSNDEPASALLDRIRAEREAQQSIPKRQRKGTGRQNSSQQGQINLPLE